MTEKNLASTFSDRADLIRCSECGGAVAPSRMRYCEEYRKAQRPRLWRIASPSGAQQVRPSPRFGRQPPVGTLNAGGNLYRTERVPICLDCRRRRRLGVMGVGAVICLGFAAAVPAYGNEGHRPLPPSGRLAFSLLPDRRRGGG